MKLVFIHGAPGSGKLTTARALLSRVNGRLFDNHAAIDVARTVFDFGAPGFWDLVQTVRRSVLNETARRCIPLLVMTFVYVEPDDLATFEEFEAIVQGHGGQLLPVFLQCSAPEIFRRIGNADRVARKKMRSEQRARFPGPTQGLSRSAADLPRAGQQGGCCRRQCSAHHPSLQPAT